ncbi:hypothetical protein JTE90_003233 [Oedothorax gibbosus]|uniref:Uncharacterized protein n=1 Tax=Oedothorax gibbosus TaxID=931172 RepID=A0AAV6UPQ4_9ARAC|nr:hypothetical protein JTE90_003233 [Oedothorax gibbosus]
MHQEIALRTVQNQIVLSWPSPDTPVSSTPPLGLSPKRLFRKKENELMSFGRGRKGMSCLVGFGMEGRQRIKTPVVYMMGVIYMRFPLLNSVLGLGAWFIGLYCVLRCILLTVHFPVHYMSHIAFFLDIRGQSFLTLIHFTATNIFHERNTIHMTLLFCKTSIAKTVPFAPCLMKVDRGWPQNCLLSLIGDGCRQGWSLKPSSKRFLYNFPFKELSLQETLQRIQIPLEDKDKRERKKRKLYFNEVMR